MTATDWDQTTNHTDYGAPGVLGSAPGAPRTKQTASTPNYPAKSVFARPEIRALVADIVQAKVNELNGSAEFGTAFLVNQLDEVLNELTPEKKGVVE